MKLVSVFFFTLFLLVAHLSIAQESFTEFHKNGEIAFQGSKTEGKLVGEHASFYEDGRLKSVARYNSGYLIQKKEYYNTGELHNTSYFIDGTEFFKIFYYYKNGQLQKEGKIDRSGLESGEWLYYSEDNQLLKMEVYEKGKIVN